MSDVITHKCPNCDGPLTYSPSDELFTCDYCLSEFTVADIASFEEPEEKNEALKDTVMAVFEENLSEETQASVTRLQKKMRCILLCLYSLVPVAEQKLSRMKPLRLLIATIVITPSF